MTIEGEEVDNPEEYKSDEPVRSEIDVEVNATDEPQESPDKASSEEGSSDEGSSGNGSSEKESSDRG